MIKGCSRAMGAGFTSINTVGQLTRHLGRKYVNRMLSTFLIPKQIPPGFKKKKEMKKKNQNKKTREKENVSCIYWYTRSGRLKRNL